MIMKNKVTPKIITITEENFESLEGKTFLIEKLHKDDDFNDKDTVHNGTDGKPFNFKQPFTIINRKNSVPAFLCDPAWQKYYSVGGFIYLHFGIKVQLVDKSKLKAPTNSALKRIPIKSYFKRQLDTIAHTLNVLNADSDKTTGLNFNTYHFTRFFNKTHYIDYQEAQKKFKVYRKYKGWKPNEETITLR